MKKQSDSMNPAQSDTDPAKPKEEKTLSQRLKEKGYSNSKVGQGFVMSWQPPRKEKKAT
jgi:hypothetical protein